MGCKICQERDLENELPLPSYSQSQRTAISTNVKNIVAPRIKRDGCEYLTSYKQSKIGKLHFCVQGSSMCYFQECQFVERYSAAFL